LALTKEAVRRELLRKRIEISPRRRREKDRRIIRNLLSLEELHAAERVLLYYPVKGEPDITPLLSTLIASRGGIVLPKVEGDQLTLYSVEDLGSLRRGRFGVPEPSRGERVDPAELDLAVIPGVIFDRHGYRIGFGKGYYDRLLSRIRSPKVGVAYSFQVLEEIPRDPWDKPVDMVVTEEEVIRRS